MLSALNTRKPGAEGFRKDWLSSLADRLMRLKVLLGMSGVARQSSVNDDDFQVRYESSDGGRSFEVEVQLTSVAFDATGQQVVSSYAHVILSTLPSLDKTEDASPF